MQMRFLLSLGLLLSLSCDALFGGFSQPNPKNCVRNPTLCEGGEVCDSLTEKCVKISPDADFFAAPTSTHTTEASHVLSGNFDGDAYPDVLLVGQGSTTVLYNVGTSLESRRELKTKSPISAFIAQATRIDFDDLDDLAIVTEAGVNNGGTIELCSARANMSEPFSCNPPADLKFFPKAAAIVDLLSAPFPELVALDKDGDIRICQVSDLQEGVGVCDVIAPVDRTAIMNAQMVVLGDVNGDRLPDVAVIYPSGAKTRLRVLRSASGGKPTLTSAIELDVQDADLAAGNFLQNDTPCVAIVGAQGGVIKAMQFCALANDDLPPHATVTTDSTTLAADPTTGRRIAVGQFDGVGSKPDDLAIQMGNQSTVFVLGSKTGLGAPTSSMAPFVQQPASRLVAAPFTRGTGGRSDLLFFNHPNDAGGGRVGLMRSTGSLLPQALMTRATLVTHNASQAPNHTLVHGSFSSAGMRQLALLQNQPAELTIYTRVANADFSPQTLATVFSAQEVLVAATALSCGNGQDALVATFRDDARPALLRYRGTQPERVPLTNDVRILQLVTADANGDRLADLIALRSDGKIVAAMAQQTGCMLKEFTPLTDTVPIPANPFFAVGDLNADGAMDLAVRGDGSVRVLLQRRDAAGNSLGTFDALGDFPFPQGTVAGQMAIGEFRSKGQPELMISLQPPTGNSLLYAIGLSSDRRTLVGIDTMSNTLLKATALVSGDFNRDGLQDVVLIDKATELLSVTTWRTPAAPNTRAYYVGHAPAAVAVGPLDGDDLPDLAFAVQIGSMQGLVALSVAYAMPAGSLK